MCWNCTRLEKTCSYPDVVTSESSQYAGTIIGPSARDMDVEDLQSTISHESAQDLELLHHYSTRTSLTLADEEMKREVWQINVPRHAFSHRFLLHGLLSLAALHRSQDYPAAQHSYYIERARKHHSQALSQYIPLLQNINRENCHALFAFSALIGALSYGLLQLADDDERPEELMNGVVETFDLLKGSTIIAEQARSWLSRGDLKYFMVLYTAATSSTPPAEHTNHAALESLLDRVQSTPFVRSGDLSGPEGPSTSDGAIYTHSIHQLFRVLETTHSDMPKIGTVLFWPLTVDQAFINLLKARDPTALVILAHYGTALHRLNDVWWLRTLGGRLCRAIFLSLDPEWHSYLNLQSWQAMKQVVTVKRPAHHQ